MSRPNPSALEKLHTLASATYPDSGVMFPTDGQVGPDLALTYGDLREVRRRLEELERYHTNEVERERREFVRAYVIQRASDGTSLDRDIEDARIAWHELAKEGL